MKEMRTSSGLRVSINVNYIVSIDERKVSVGDKPHTLVTTVDGHSHLFRGTYEEVLKELA